MGLTIKAIIWDMGGVLLRTDDKTSRTELGKKYSLTAEQVADLVFNQEVSLKASLGKANEDNIWQNVAEKLHLDPHQLEEFRTAFWAGDHLDTRLTAFITSLRPAYKTALLSNAWAGARRTLTETYHCIDIFDEVVISAEVGVMKPDPAIYHLVIRKLGIEPTEAVFIDDVQVNIDAANQVGIHGIRFISTDQVIRDVTEKLDSHH